MQNTKYQAVKTLARVRGIKEFSSEQLAQIDELSKCTEISATDILNEVTNAPKYRTERTIKAARSHASNLFGAIAKTLEPRD